MSLDFVPGGFTSWGVTPTSTKTVFYFLGLSTLHHLNSNSRRLRRLTLIRPTTIINGNMRTTLRTRQRRSTPIRVDHRNQINFLGTLTRPLLSTINRSTLPATQGRSIRNPLILRRNVRRLPHRHLYLVRYRTIINTKCTNRSELSRLIFRYVNRHMSILVINVGHQFISTNRHARIFCLSFFREILLPRFRRALFSNTINANSASIRGVRLFHILISCPAIFIFHQ